MALNLWGSRPRCVKCIVPGTRKRQSAQGRYRDRIPNVRILPPSVSDPARDAHANVAISRASRFVYRAVVTISVNSIFAFWRRATRWRDIPGEVFLFFILFSILNNSMAFHFYGAISLPWRGWWERPTRDLQQWCTILIQQKAARRPSMKYKA